MEILPFITTETWLPGLDCAKVLLLICVGRNVLKRIWQTQGHIRQVMDLKLDPKATAQTVLSLDNNYAGKSKELILKIKISSIMKEQSSYPEGRKVTLIAMTFCCYSEAFGLCLSGGYLMNWPIYNLVEWTLDIHVGGWGSRLSSTGESGSLKYVMGTVGNLLTGQTKTTCSNAFK